MMRLLWVDGRFGWPLVIAVLFVTLSILAIDFVWRMVVVPAHTLAVYALIADSLGGLIVIAGWLLVSRLKRS